MSIISEYNILNYSKILLFCYLLLVFMFVVYQVPGFLLSFALILTCLKWIAQETQKLDVTFLLGKIAPASRNSLVIEGSATETHRETFFILSAGTWRPQLEHCWFPLEPLLPPDLPPLLRFFVMRGNTL